jgi:hypothetical protein
MPARNTCVILSSSHAASNAYGRAVAATRNFDVYTPDQVSYLSLSRYRNIFFVDNPESLVGSYLIHQFRGKIFGLVASCDAVLMADHLVSVRQGGLSGVLLPNKDQVDKIARPDVHWLPVQLSSQYPVVLPGLSAQEPGLVEFLAIAEAHKIPFLLSPPYDKNLMDLLEKFPVSFGAIASSQEDPALFQAKVVVVPGTDSDRVSLKVDAFGISRMSLREFVQKWDSVVRGVRQDFSWEAFATDINLDSSESDDSVCALKTSQPFRKLRNLVIKFPTRARPDKFYSVIREYADKLSGRNNVRFEITIDSDDPSMPHDEVVKKLAPYEQGEFISGEDGREHYQKWGRVTISVRSGRSKGKIDAVNRDLSLVPDYDVILLASDDMVPVAQNYDDIILQAMESHFPDTNGVLWFNDGYTGQRLNTLVCAGRDYVKSFNYLYHPSYKSLWCDNEFMRVANMHGRQAYIDWTIIRHEHPANTGSGNDALYDVNEKWYHKDQETFNSRQKTNFDGTPQRVLLSILIPTLIKRRVIRKNLISKLTSQISEFHADGLVEILLDEDDGKKSIGEKRNSLVQRAKGEYVVFIDDDDDVADCYVVRIVNALASADVDCATFGGLLIDNNSVGKLFVHSMRFNEYKETSSQYIRFPNHINAIRRKIAAAHPFPKKNFSEDFDFAVALKNSGAIKSERFIPIPMYIYRPTDTGASHAASKTSPGVLSKAVKYVTGPVKSAISSEGKRRSSPRTIRTRRI